MGKQQNQIAVVNRRLDELERKHKPCQLSQNTRNRFNRFSDRYTQDVTNFGAQLDRLRGKDSELEERLRENQDEVSGLSEQLDGYQEEVSELNEQLDGYQDDILDLRQHLDQALDQNHELRGRLQKAIDELQERNHELEKKLDRSIDEMKQQIDETPVQTQLFNRELQDIRAGHADHQADLETHTCSINYIETSIQAIFAILKDSPQDDADESGTSSAEENSGKIQALMLKQLVSSLDNGLQKRVFRIVEGCDRVSDQEFEQRFTAREQTMTERYQRLSEELEKRIEAKWRDSFREEQLRHQAALYNQSKYFLDSLKNDLDIHLERKIDELRLEYQGDVSRSHEICSRRMDGFEEPVDIDNESITPPTNLQQSARVSIAGTEAGESSKQLERHGPDVIRKFRLTVRPRQDADEVGEEETEDVEPEGAEANSVEAENTETEESERHTWRDQYYCHRCKKELVSNDLDDDDRPGQWFSIECKWFKPRPEDNVFEWCCIPCSEAMRQPANNADLEETQYAEFPEPVASPDLPGPKLSPSIWSIPSSPNSVPDHLDVVDLSSEMTELVSDYAPSDVSDITITRRTKIGNLSRNPWTEKHDEVLINAMTGPLSTGIRFKTQRFELCSRELKYRFNEDRSPAACRNRWNKSFKRKFDAMSNANHVEETPKLERVNAVDGSAVLSDHMESGSYSGSPHKRPRESDTIVVKPRKLFHSTGVPMPSKPSGSSTESTNGTSQNDHSARTPPTSVELDSSYSPEQDDLSGIAKIKLEENESRVAVSAAPHARKLRMSVSRPQRRDDSNVDPESPPHDDDDVVPGSTPLAHPPTLSLVTPQQGTAAQTSEMPSASDQVESRQNETNVLSVDAEESRATSVDIATWAANLAEESIKTEAIETSGIDVANMDPEATEPADSDTESTEIADNDSEFTIRSILADAELEGIEPDTQSYTARKGNEIRSIELQETEHAEAGGANEQTFVVVPATHLGRFRPL